VFDEHAMNGQLNRRTFGEVFAQFSMDLQQYPHEVKMEQMLLMEKVR
jgi:hypothetical protein